jgi:phosphoacetylglucosamine mutase
MQLIDGDRQGTVLTEFFKKLSDELNERTAKFNEKGVLHLQVPCTPTIGFVQTFYANCSSTDYLKLTFNMEPIYTATGVKHLHAKAELYDIGIYFEANGHGTVVMNKNYLNRVEALVENREQLESL